MFSFYHSLTKPMSFYYNKCLFPSQSITNQSHSVGFFFESPSLRISPSTFETLYNLFKYFSVEVLAQVRISPSTFEIFHNLFKCFSVKVLGHFSKYFRARYIMNTSFKKYSHTEKMVIIRLFKSQS
jgi:hypothetical protein